MRCPPPPCMHQICRILIFHITINKQSKNFIKRILTPSVLNPAWNEKRILIIFSVVSWNSTEPLKYLKVLKKKQKTWKSILKWKLRFFFTISALSTIAWLLKVGIFFSDDFSLSCNCKKGEIFINNYFLGFYVVQLFLLCEISWAKL